MTNEEAVSKEKLVQDFKVVIADAEELLRATAGQAGEKIAVVRERMQENLSRAKVKLAEVEDIVIDRTRQAARAADQYVHENPWAAVGVAAGVGFLLGLLIGRR